MTPHDRVDPILEPSDMSHNIIVIKYGGAAMERDEVRQAVCQEISDLCRQGIKIVVVHGGGKEISRLLERLGMPARFIDGLRVTDPETMRITEMVLSGLINKDLVSRITRAGAPALGFSGRDAHMLEGIPMKGARGEDLGLTGEVSRVNTQPIMAALHANLIPVISPVGESEKGSALNLNADYAAAAIAGALRAKTCIFLTDVSGVKKDGAVLPQLSPEEVRTLIADGTISGGMIPKVQCALRALSAGCARARICDASTPSIIHLSLTSSPGTLVSETAR